MSKGAGKSAGLSDDLQTDLNEKKVQMRMENEKYLREHPEVRQLVSKFLKSVLVEQPSDVKRAATCFFTSDISYEDISQ